MLKHLYIDSSINHLVYRIRPNPGDQTSKETMTSRAHHRVATDWVCKTMDSCAFWLRVSRIRRIGFEITMIPIQGSSKVFCQKPIRRIVVLIVLLMAILGMTFGIACHHHDDCSAGACTLCHLVIVPMAAGVHAWWVPVPIGTVAEAIYLDSIASSVRRLPARAPPA